MKTGLPEANLEIPSTDIADVANNVASNNAINAADYNGNDKKVHSLRINKNVSTANAAKNPNTSEVANSATEIKCIQDVNIINNSVCKGLDFTKKVDSAKMQKIIKDSNQAKIQELVRNLSNTNVSKLAKDDTCSKSQNDSKNLEDDTVSKEKKRRCPSEWAGPIPKISRGSYKHHSSTSSPAVKIYNTIQLRVVEALISSKLSLDDFITILEKNTRTIEAQLFMEQLRHFIHAVDGGKWREEVFQARLRNQVLAKSAVIHYGSIGCTKELENIYDAIHATASGGMAMSIIGTRPIMLPSHNIPKWNGMLFCTRKVGFTANGIQFDTLLARSTKLRVVVVNTCKLMGKMLHAVSKVSTIQALVCKQRVYLVPEGQNSNLFWKRHKRASVKVLREMAVDVGSGNRLTLLGHVYFKSMEVLSYICNTAAPASKMAEAKAKRELTINQMKLLGA
uniref:Reverse transcriptase domain-containing protein n=1 Tax=Strongyloides papillosus TaxID=174720 RepID=A0A0N5CHA2_STREA